MPEPLEYTGAVLMQDSGRKSFAKARSVTASETLQKQSDHSSVRLVTLVTQMY